MNSVSVLHISLLISSYLEVDQVGFSLGPALGMDTGCGFQQTAPVCQASVLGYPWKLFKFPQKHLVARPTLIWHMN